MWTGDGRVFFYNPSTKKSVWERPEELAERADVTKAMSTVPEQLLASHPANVVPSNRTAAAVVTAPVVVTPASTIIIGSAANVLPVAAADKEVDGGESESESGDEFPSKKFKGDGE